MVVGRCEVDDGAHKADKAAKAEKFIVIENILADRVVRPIGRKEAPPWEWLLVA